MKAVKALGLVFALAMLPLAVIQVSVLQAEGTGLTNGVGAFLNYLTAILMIIMVVIGVGFLIWALTSLLRAR